jgi:hypothetical protein
MLDTTWTGTDVVKRSTMAFSLSLTTCGCKSWSKAQGADVVKRSTMAFSLSLTTCERKSWSKAQGADVVKLCLGG